MAWLGRSLGDFGSQLGESKDIALGWRERQQRMAIEAARQKLSEMMLPLQIEHLKQQIGQFGQPERAGLTSTPGGGTAGISFDPKTGSYKSQELIPGMGKEAAKAQILKMAQSVQSKEAHATLQAYADSIDAGEDPQNALQKALAFMGTSATHSDVTGRVKPGQYIPDKSSITGVSREKVDGMGNVVGTYKNVIMPGMQVKVTEGWEKAHDDESGLDYLVPKTTKTTPIVPGMGRSAGVVGEAKQQVGPDGKPLSTDSAMPPGSRIIGSHASPEQKEAIRASKDASQAFATLNTAEEDLKTAKQGNPKASLALVFGAVRSMVAGAGRMTNVEIEQELKAGSYDQRIERWYSQAVDGTMPEDQMDYIMEVIRGAYEGKRKAGELQYKYAYPKKPLPPWLRPKEEAAPSGAPPPPPKGFVMKTPGPG